MVRKRLRRRKSEDIAVISDESDGPDFEIHPDRIRKTYSLRQRKQPVVAANLSEDSDDDSPLAKPSKGKGSDDDDYKIEESSEKQAKREISKNSEKSAEKAPQDCISTDPNELIDFEDVIRADIVVNKRVDYDTLIERSEINSQSNNTTQGTKRKQTDTIPSNKVQKSVGKDFHTNFLDFLGGNDKNSSDNEHEGELLDCSQMLETQLTEKDDDSVGSDDLPLIKTKEKLLESKIKELFKADDESSKYETNSDDGDVILLEPPREVIVLDDD